MRLLVLKAYLKLIQFDLYLARGNFEALYQKVKCFPRGERQERSEITERVCVAVDTACIWYWKRVLCLQRAAATACLLKQSGLDARLTIGVQQVPFKAHAWVEVDGKVVNDKPYMAEVYTILDRC